MSHPKRNIHDDQEASNRSNGTEFDNYMMGLPMSLPSYTPEHTNPSLSAAISGGKRQAPVGQWKTPPQFLYSARDPRISGGNTTTTAAAFNAMSFQETSTRVLPPPSSTVTITNEQFVSSTGLQLNTAIIAKMSGKEEGDLTIDNIQSIMNRPDMMSIYQKLQEEDERRRKRLARNRSSARARREKKKNLVETHEAEVSQLETKLKDIDGYQWGFTNNTKQLEDLLCQTQQFPKMPTEQKREYVRLLLKKGSLAAQTLQTMQYCNELVLGSGALQSEVKAALKITPEQEEKLALIQVQSTTRQLAIADKCLAALRTHNWLQFPSIEHTLKYHITTLSTQQLTKLSQWARLNESVIEKLSICSTDEMKQAVAKTENEVIFHFKKE